MCHVQFSSCTSSSPILHVYARPRVTASVQCTSTGSFHRGPYRSLESGPAKSAMCPKQAQRLKSLNNVRGTWLRRYPATLRCRNETRASERDTLPSYAVALPRSRGNLCACYRRGRRCQLCHPRFLPEHRLWTPCGSFTAFRSLNGSISAGFHPVFIWRCPA